MAAFFDYPDGDVPSGGEFVFLDDLSRSDWARLIALMERRRFEAGDEVMSAGEADRSLYLVASGQLEVIVTDGRRSRRVREQGPGTILGEVAFFDGKPRSATIRALTAGEVLRLSEDGFEVLAARHPDLGRKVLIDLGRVLAQRLRLGELTDGG